MVTQHKYKLPRRLKIRFDLYHCKEWSLRHSPNLVTATDFFQTPTFSAFTHFHFFQFYTPNSFIHVSVVTITPNSLMATRF